MREKGYSFGKIAKILGLSKQTVYNRYNNWLLQEERKKVESLSEEYTRKLEELEQKEMELQKREKNTGIKGENHRRENGKLSRN